MAKTNEEETKHNQEKKKRKKSKERVNMMDFLLSNPVLHYVASAAPYTRDETARVLLLFVIAHRVSLRCLSSPLVVTSFSLRCAGVVQRCTMTMSTEALLTGVFLCNRLVPNFRNGKYFRFRQY